jgi:hypothetical protein
LNWEGPSEIYRDTLRTFEIFAYMSLAHRGRRAERSLVKFQRGEWWGLEEKGSTSFRSSRRTYWGPGKRKGMVGGGVPTALVGEGVSVEEKGQAWA